MTPALQTERVDTLGPIALHFRDNSSRRSLASSLQTVPVLRGRGRVVVPRALHDQEKVRLTTAQIVLREVEKTILRQEGHAVKVQG